MDYDRLQISIHSDVASRKQRCSEKMEELKNTQFSSAQDAASPLLHKELVGEKNIMIFELYDAVEKGDMDNFVDVLGKECAKRKVPLSDIFDQVTGAGDSLLHVAADLGSEQIAELISGHFPELLTRRNVRGDTPLHVAVRSKNSTIVKLILSQYAIQKSKHDGFKDKEITRETNEYGNTPLHEAVYSGHFGVVEEILHADEPVVHYLNKSRSSPLFLSVMSPDVKILNLLLSIPFPADQPLPQCFGNSPLHAAIRKRNPGISSSHQMFGKCYF
ncbi:ankyrin repeat-containing protein At5g02620-like [Vigna umbellata]|uniref:ankyrin repeat-containing protein At5g02620-like n=1 Tax=Vigna umbellata TaxID=87088 RepID=UPI001F5FCF56|nr:ankyrin repeat-containing protein At5g02620-like [Vigna umbellata]